MASPRATSSGRTAPPRSPSGPRSASPRAPALAGAVLAVVACAQARVGRAQPAPLAARPAPRITWDAPASCPSADAFAARVASYLRDSRRDAGAVRLHVQIERPASAGAGYALTLRVITPDGSFDRALADPDCGGVVGVAALVAAMAIDPLSALPDPGARVVTVAPVDDCEAPPALFVSGEPPRCPGRPAHSLSRAGGRARTRAVVRFGVGVDAGTLPALTPGVGVIAGVGRDIASGRGFWQLELGGAYYIEQRSVTRTEPVVAGGNISLWAATARACGGAALPGGRWAVCAVTELGWMQGRGFGYPEPDTGGAPWWGVGGSLGYALPVSDFFRFHAELSVMSGISRPRFLECACADCASCPAALVDRIWQPQEVTGRVVTGVEWVFP